MNTRKSAASTRRSFFWRLGAGASAALASTAGMARPAAAGNDDAARRAARLEAEIALRQLHAAFEQAMDKGRYEEAVGMFSDDAEVLFNGVTFTQRNQGVSRLLLEHFQAGKTGKRIEAAPGFELGAGQQQDEVQVSPDLQRATAAFPYSIQVGMPIESETSLASMGRLHGEGVRSWWEGGRYNASYEKDATDGRWKISRLEYRTLSRADYRPGRSWATAMPDSPLAMRQLEDLRGRALLSGTDSGRSIRQRP